MSIVKAFRKHFVKHGLFELFQLFQFTLINGNKVAEVVKKGADLFLFRKTL